ncbi:hypothetical protein [Streptomyces sp. NPDC053048]|uniref:hypothetical protein n=1 Tax=Streptomyces sp. NPDC053048 TaxID=3365694 RepID=UPI0037D224D8
MEYTAPTAGLIIAAVLFLIGVLSVNDLAARDFKVTISGKVGPFQRGILVAASVLCLVLSVVGFYLLANRPSGSGQPPPGQTAPVGRQMTIRVSSSLPAEDQEVVQETDVVTVNGARVTLSMDSDRPQTNDVLHFEGEPGELEYKVEITMVSRDGSKQEYSGSGTIYIDNGLSYIVQLSGDDPPQAVLERAAG